MAYKVTAPLVVVKDQAGRLRHTYFGAIVPWLNDEQRDHFLRLGLVEKIEPAAAETVPAPVAEGTAAAEGTVPASAKPVKVAPKEAWVDYGVANGHDRAELEALNKPDLVDLLS